MERNIESEGKREKYTERGNEREVKSYRERDRKRERERERERERVMDVKRRK